MLLPSFFVVDYTKYDRLPLIEIPENILLSYKVTSGSDESLISFYRKLFLAATKYPFCLLLDAEQELNQPAHVPRIDFLISFSFHVRYLKTSHDNPLVLFEIGEDREEKYVSLVREAFKNQGYNDIEAIAIHKSIVPDPKNEGKNIRFTLDGNTKDLLPDYIRSIEKLTSADSSFFFFLDNPEDLPGAVDVIQNAEAIIQSDRPLIYGLIRENTSLKGEKQQLASKIELLQEQLASSDNYRFNYNLPEPGFKKQVEELVTFYKNEYEILPLWYKRLGHIIKVIMGKRTFRSLFNDNVKKYKD